MKKIILVTFLLGLSSTCFSQNMSAYYNSPFYPRNTPSNLEVPGFDACQRMFAVFMNCSPGWVAYGDARCVAIDSEYNQVLQCPEVEREQSTVTGNPAAGIPPNYVRLNELRRRR